MTIVFTERGKQEGYWRTTQEEESPLPCPAPDESWGDPEVEEFLNQLLTVEGKAEKIDWRGWSLSRLTGEKVGTHTFRLQGWEWPEGYSHYLRRQVRPSKEFEAFILEEYEKVPVSLVKG